MASRCARSERLQASSKQPLCRRDSRPRSNGPTVRTLTACGFGWAAMSGPPPPAMLPHSTARRAAGDRGSSAVAGHRPLRRASADASRARYRASARLNHVGALAAPIARQPWRSPARDKALPTRPRPAPATTPVAPNGSTAGEALRVDLVAARIDDHLDRSGIGGTPGAITPRPSISSVPTPSTGHSRARASARATAMPARRPVKLPGPTVTATSSSSRPAQPASAITLAQQRQHPLGVAARQGLVTPCAHGGSVSGRRRDRRARGVEREQTQGGQETARTSTTSGT